MDMQPLQAGFATQDQAESVIRKLSALRGDRFRLERAGGTAPGAAEQWNAEFGSELGGGAEFQLSVHVPKEAESQARTVIQQAGGELY